MIYRVRFGKHGHAFIKRAASRGADVEAITREPGADISDLPDDIQAAISSHWTPAVLQAWEADKAARLAEYEAEKPQRDDERRRFRARHILERYMLRRFVNQVDNEPGTPAELQQAIDVLRDTL